MPLRGCDARPEFQNTPYGRHAAFARRTENGENPVGIFEFDNVTACVGRVGGGCKETEITFFPDDPLTVATTFEHVRGRRRSATKRSPCTDTSDRRRKTGTRWWSVVPEKRAPYAGETTSPSITGTVNVVIITPGFYTNIINYA